MNRCKCSTLKGDQCTKKATKGPYCAIHTKKCGRDFGPKMIGAFTQEDTIKDLIYQVDFCKAMRDFKIKDLS